MVNEVLDLRVRTNLVTKCDTTHTILNPENVIVDRVRSNHIKVCTHWTINIYLRVIDSRKVQGTRWLGLVHGKTEWPCIYLFRIDRVVKNRTVSRWNDVSMVFVCHIFKEWNTVNKHRRVRESI